MINTMGKYMHYPYRTTVCLGQADSEVAVKREYVDSARILNLRHYAARFADGGRIRYVRPIPG